MVDKNITNPLSQYKKEICKIIEGSFGSLVDYSFLTGSTIYKKRLKKTDIDLTVVLKQEAIAKNCFIRRIREFKAGFIEMQEREGFIPDYIWPGEIITDLHIQDAIKGRGFSVSDKGIYLPDASKDYYLDSFDNEFRAWLSQICFNQFLEGNQELFKQRSEEGWQSLVLYNLLSSGVEEITMKDLMSYIKGEDNKWEGVGLHSGYERFDELEMSTLEKILGILVKNNIIQIEKGYKYLVSKIKLQKWEDKIISRHEKRKWLSQQILKT